MSGRAFPEFLPAALAVEETPASPAGRLILWVIIAVFVLTLAWATLGRVDIVTVASGRVIASGHSKTVQPLEIGAVTAIHVTEGQAVEKGQLLLVLDDRQARAEVSRLRGELAQLSVQVERYRRLLALGSRSDAPVAEHLGQSDGPLVVQSWLEYVDRLVVLQRERLRHQAEGESISAQVEKLQAVLPIVEHKVENQRRLTDQKLLSEHQFLEVEERRLEIVHDLRTQQSRLREAQTAGQESAARMQLEQRVFVRDAQEKLIDAERRAESLSQELNKAEAGLASTRITAPVDGVVQQLAVHGAGAVVTPAQALMVVVPLDEGLEIEAVLENRDIGFVRAGQPVSIKVDTFPFTRYGTIDGTVLRVSSDAVPDQSGGMRYRLQTDLNKLSMQIDQRQVPLVPGMTVVVEAKTGTRRLIEYFLSPLMRFADESVRER